MMHFDTVQRGDQSGNPAHWRTADEWKIFRDSTFGTLSMNLTSVEMLLGIVFFFVEMITLRSNAAPRTGKHSHVHGLG